MYYVAWLHSYNVIHSIMHVCHDACILKLNAECEQLVACLSGQYAVIVLVRLDLRLCFVYTPTSDVESA